MEKLQGEMETKQAFTYMPKEVADKIPALYETDGGLIGDKVAYIRYFMPFGAQWAMDGNLDMLLFMRLRKLK